MTIAAKILALQGVDMKIIGLNEDVDVAPVEDEKDSDEIMLEISEEEHKLRSINTQVNMGNMKLTDDDKLVLTKDCELGKAGEEIML